MLVYLLLFIYSMAVLIHQFLNRKRLVLRPLIAWMWCASLLIGWAAKFALGRQYW
jgi:pheromone shutdown protein TraB